MFFAPPPISSLLIGWLGFFPFLGDCRYLIYWEVIQGFLALKLFLDFVLTFPSRSFGNGKLQPEKNLTFYRPQDIETSKGKSTDF